MSTHSLRIEEVTDLQLVPELARLTDLALQPDGFHAFANAYAPKSIYEETVDSFTAAIEDPKSYVFRAILTTVGEDRTGTNQLVGLSQWYVGYLIVPKVDPFARKLSEPRAENAPDVTDIATAGANEKARTMKIESGTSPNAFDAVGRELGNSQVRAIRGKRHICQPTFHSLSWEVLTGSDLRRMIVHPDYQRKGIGQKLLQWGVALADRENIVGWLFSRPAASKLYEKNGWKAVDSIAVDVSGMEVAPFVSMLRKPQPPRFSAQ